MFLSKVKIVAAVVMALGVAGSGVGYISHRTTAGQPEPKPTVTEKRDRSPVLAAAAPRKEKQDDPPDAEDPVKEPIEWAKRLNTVVEFSGIDDPKATLNDTLDKLSTTYGLTFDINERAFQLEGLMEVGRTPVAETPIPPMKARISTILRKILRRVPSTAGTTYLIRRDGIEITTGYAVRSELGQDEEAEAPEGARIPLVLPLVWVSSEDTPLDTILPRLAESSGYNVAADPKAGEKLQTKITVKLNNVPIDTAVRLLANMAGLSMVRLDNVFYVTTAENAKQLREEQAKINAEKGVEAANPPAKPAPEKRAK